MRDSFFFYAVGLQGRAIAEEETVGATRRAVRQVKGLSCAENVTRQDHSVSFECQGPEALEVSVSFSTDDPEWAVLVPESFLVTAEREPNVKTQTATVDVIRAVLEVVPPYVGTAVWPFGP